MSDKLIYIVLVPIFLLGCSQIPSIEEYTNTWVGQPIERIKERVEYPNSYAASIDWKETSYQLENGNWVYVEPDGKYCRIHWEVNPQGIIVGYKLEGERCY